MKCLIQRVKSAAVMIDDKFFSEIGVGILVFVGIEKKDTVEIIKNMTEKILKFRIFSDNNGKMNNSITDINGEILVVSQFTLCSDCKKGNRPSFVNSAEPNIAESLYEDFLKNLHTAKIKVKCGKFGADMQISLINDGPVTFLLEK